MAVERHKSFIEQGVISTHTESVVICLPRDALIFSGFRGGGSGGSDAAIVGTTVPFSCIFVSLSHLIGQVKLKSL